MNRFMNFFLYLRAMCTQWCTRHHFQDQLQVQGKVGTKETKTIDLLQIIIPAHIWFHLMTNEMNFIYWSVLCVFVYIDFMYMWLSLYVFCIFTQRRRRSSPLNSNDDGVDYGVCKNIINSWMNFIDLFPIFFLQGSWMELKVPSNLNNFNGS